MHFRLPLVRFRDGFDSGNERNIAMRKSVVMLTVALGWAAAGFTGTAFAEQPDKWVRYVEATGSQYVDTGIIGRWNTKAECKVVETRRGSDQGEIRILQQGSLEGYIGIPETEIRLLLRGRTRGRPDVLVKQGHSPFFIPFCPEYNRMRTVRSWKSPLSACCSHSQTPISLNPEFRPIRRPEIPIPSW